MQSDTVKVTIDADMTATELDALLRKLALLRSGMVAQVAHTLDEIEAADASVLIEDKPGLVIATRKDGGFRLWLRHQGFGWIGYQLDNLTAIGLHGYLGTNIRPGVDLIKAGVSNAH